MMVKLIYNCANLLHLMTCPENRRLKTEKVKLYLDGSIYIKKKPLEFDLPLLL